MTYYSFKSATGPPIEFEGDLLSDVSSFQTGVERWLEVRLFRTTNSSYVVETVGRTSVPGEVDLPTVTVVGSAEGVKAALRRRSTVEYLTYTSLEALRLAAEVDEGLRQELEKP